MATDSCMHRCIYGSMRIVVRRCVYVCVWPCIDTRVHVCEFDNQNYFIGVFGKIKSEDYIIQKGDRLEIYEHILLDPKERRKLIASKNKKD